MQPIQDVRKSQMIQSHAERLTVAVNRLRAAEAAYREADNSFRGSAVDHANRMVTTVELELAELDAVVQLVWLASTVAGHPLVKTLDCVRAIRFEAVGEFPHTLHEAWMRMLEEGREDVPALLEAVAALPRAVVCVVTEQDGDRLN